MVPDQKAFGAETEKYLESQEIYDLFGHLLRQLVVHQPDNPVKWLKEQLMHKPPLTVCIIGPPGVNRSKYASLIAAEFKVPHINVGRMLRGKKELRDAIEKGDLVRDDIVMETVRAELLRSKNGYVLDGFPRTKVQAQMLAQREYGFGHDKVLLLQTGDNIIRARFAAKMTHQGLDPADMADVIERKLQQYHRHILTIVELFKRVIRPIEIGAGDSSGTDINAHYAIIKQCLHMRPYSNAPLRAPRICVIGPCASGRTSQSKTVAKQYGLVHVDVAKLLRSHQISTGMAVEEVPPEFLSDEEICDLVGRRLNDIDCIRKGWVLDGFPKTASQAEFLRQSHLWPTRILHLQLDEEEVLKRVFPRRIDPVTGQAYYRSPNDITVRQRLVQAEHDKPEAVSERYAMYKENAEKAAKCFSEVTFNVPAVGDQIEVFTVIRDRLNQPLASETAQDSAGTEYDT